MKEIKAKQIGLSMLLVIDGKKYSKKCTKEEISSIKNKVLLYEKKPSETLKKQILKLIDKTIIEKETIKAKEKGLKKAIKKSKSKVIKKKEESKSLVDQVEQEFKEGNLTESEIKQLEDLLRKQKVSLQIEEKPQTAPIRRSGEY